MSFPSTPTYTAVTLPAPPVNDNSSILTFSQAAVSLAPPTLPSSVTLEQGDSVVMPARWNRNAFGIDLVSILGAGVCAVVYGMQMATTSGLIPTVTAGGFQLGGATQLEVDTALSDPLPDNTANNYIWARQGDAYLQATLTLSPPDLVSPWIYIGQCTTSGGNITAVDNSGVCYMTSGGLPIRSTADAGIPTDVPPDTWMGLTRTLDGLYYWDGISYYEMVPAGTAPRCRKVSFTYTDFSDAALFKTITALTLPPGGVIRSVKIKHSVAFGGGAVATCTLEVGIVGTLNKYAAAFNIFQAPGNTVQQLSTVQGTEDHATAVAIKATLRTTGANTNALSAGTVDIWITYDIEV